MNNLRTLAFVLSFAFAAACTAGVGSTSQKVSCYSNTQGVQCTATPDGVNGADQTVDLDSDGQDDDYVCSDYTGESNDADNDGQDNATDTDDDGDGVSDADDNDDDGDGIDDNDDCDNQGVDVDEADEVDDGNDSDSDDGADTGTDTGSDDGASA